MFTLRYLIATTRRGSPLIFTHRDYRGQRTTPDPLHTDFTTYPCKDYTEFQKLFEHVTKNQPSSQIHPLVELHNEATGERRKITGDEVVFLKSQIAEELRKSATESSSVEPQLNPPPSSSTPQAEGSVHPPVRSPSSDAGTPARTEDPAPPNSPQTQATTSPSPETTANTDSASLQSRILPLVTEKKRTTADLANALGVSKDAIAEAVRAEDSKLLLTGGHWVGPA